MSKLWVILCLLCACSTDPTYEYGRLSYQTQDSSNLPVVIRVNTTPVDTLFSVDSTDCIDTEEWIFLIAGSTYTIEADGTRYNKVTELLIEPNTCKLFEI